MTAVSRNILIRLVLATIVIALVAWGVVHARKSGVRNYVDITKDVGGLGRDDLVGMFGDPYGEQFDLLLPGLGVTDFVWKKYQENTGGERPEKIYLISWKKDGIVTVIWMEHPGGVALGGVRWQIP